MNYSQRTLIAHVGLFVLSRIAFISPVMLGIEAFLPVWFSGSINIVIALWLLYDAAHLFFAPSQRPFRSLRLLSACAGLAFLIGWILWIYIHSSTSAGTGSYRTGTFLLGVGTILTIFVAIISFGDSRKPQAR